MDYIIQWQAHEYEYIEKDSNWFWAVGIITFGLAIATFAVGNVLFGILIILAGFTLALHAARKPEIMNFEINQKGVMVDSVLYPYTTLESFWIDDLSTPHPKIILKSEKFFMPHIIIPYPEEIFAEEIEDYLSYYINEEQMHEPIAHKMMEYLGF